MTSNREESMTILESYKEYLDGQELTTEEDKKAWKEFLKSKYGIPKEEDMSDEGVSYGV